MNKITIFLASFTFILVIFSGLSSLFIINLTQENITCNVESKERVIYGENSKYLIFCSDEVLENTDTLWGWKWNSSDFYRDIKEGQEYELVVYGWRVPFMSWHRNILEIK